METTSNTPRPFVVVCRTGLCLPLPGRHRGIQTVHLFRGGARAALVCYGVEELETFDDLVGNLLERDD